MYCKNMKSGLLRASLLVLMLGLISGCGGGGSGGDSSVTNKPIAGQAGRGLLPSLALSDDAFDGDHHAGSGTCAACHNGPEMSVRSLNPNDDTARDLSIGTAWETSVMANATRDPYWHAVVASELDNFPNLEDDINDKCIVCHAPTAHDLAKKAGLDLRLFDKGSEAEGNLQRGFYSMDNTDELFNHAMDGVTCTLCHQMDGANFGTDEGMTGGYVINGSPTGDKADRPAYGQYADPDGAYMREQVGFQAQHGPHLSTSESCATCHNLNIVPVDPQGQKIDGAEHFAEQAIYTEWLNSDYAMGGPKEASCQTCHMPKVNEPVKIAETANELRPDFAEHTFLGANTVMQDMFKNFGDQLGIKPGLDFDSAIARNREFLKTSATVSINQVEPEQGKLNFDVLVENHTGHKLPGGYHSRRVYLHVQVLDERGQLVFESGKINADGSIVGVSEDINPASWEQHYDVITSETQVQVYQTIVGDSDNNRTHSLLSGSFFLKDNRLLPSGLDKNAIKTDASLPDTVGTFGQAMDDNDFNSGFDTVSYRLPMAASGIYTVSVELRYQPFSYGHLQKLFTQGDRVDQVDMFRTIYDGTSLRDEIIDTATQIMQ